VRKGQDDLAREALARRKAADSAAGSLKAQLDAQRRALEQLTANVRVLETKVVEARNKRETLKSRAAAAKSSKAVQEMVAGLRLNTTSAWAAFDIMEEKVVALEAEVCASSYVWGRVGDGGGLGGWSCCAHLLVVDRTPTPTSTLPQATSTTDTATTNTNTTNTTRPSQWASWPRQTASSHASCRWRGLGAWRTS